MAGGLDPRAPVLVGAAALTQRASDPTRALDAVGLMAQAIRAAADEAGGRDPHRLISQADLMFATQGSWKCQDPARMVSERLGISPHTVYAELGVLQQTLFTRAATAIARGEASVVLICGGEARARMASAAKAGITVEPEPEAKTPADTVLSPRSRSSASWRSTVSSTLLRASTRSSRPRHGQPPASRSTSTRRGRDALGRVRRDRRYPPRGGRRGQPCSATERRPQEPLVLLAVHQAARLVLDGRPGAGFISSAEAAEARESVNIGVFRMRPLS